MSDDAARAAERIGEKHGWPGAGLRHSIAAIIREECPTTDLHNACRQGLIELEGVEWCGDYDSCPRCGKTNPARMDAYREAQPENKNFNESAFGHTWPVGMCPMQRTIELLRTALGESEKRDG